VPDSASKTCSKCGAVKPLDQFYKDRTKRDGHQGICRECQRGLEHQRYWANREARLEWQRRYTEANGQAIRDYQRRYRQANRDAVLSHYGRVCACCGTAEKLTVDHINGDGAQHRQELYGDPQQGSSRFYIWLIKQGFPAGYQTLCLPCNSSKRSGERCRLDHGRV
jgi:hypothetical protein